MGLPLAVHTQPLSPRGNARGMRLQSRCAHILCCCNCTASNCTACNCNRLDFCRPPSALPIHPWPLSTPTYTRPPPHPTSCSYAAHGCSKMQGPRLGCSCTAGPAVQPRRHLSAPTSPWEWPQAGQQRPATTWRSRAPALPAGACSWGNCSSPRWQPRAATQPGRCSRKPGSARACAQGLQWQPGRTNVEAKAARCPKCTGSHVDPPPLPPIYLPGC